MCCDISVWLCCCGLAGVDMLGHSSSQGVTMNILIWSWCSCLVDVNCCVNILVWRWCCGLAGVDVLGHSSSQGVTTNILMWPRCFCLAGVDVLGQHFNVALMLWSYWCRCVVTQPKPRCNNISVWPWCCGLAGVDVLGNSLCQGVTTF